MEDPCSVSERPRSPAGIVILFFVMSAGATLGLLLLLARSPGSTSPPRAAPVAANVSPPLPTTWLEPVARSPAGLDPILAPRSWPPPPTDGVVLEPIGPEPEPRSIDEPPPVRAGL